MIKVCPLMDGAQCRMNCAWWNHLDDECLAATLATLATLAIQRLDREGETNE